MNKTADTGETLGKITKEQYLEALEQAHQGLDEERLNDEGEGPELSEAEQLVAHAEPPKRRTDGGAVGSIRERQLTAKQLKYAQGLIEGKTQLQAYKEAYPDARGDDRALRASAWGLSRHPKIQAKVKEAIEQTSEVMLEDMIATKRYVMRGLIEHSQTAKQEGTKLKALELLGKASGLFKAEDDKKDDKLTADQIKQELAGHLKLLDNVRPIKREAIKGG